VAEQHRAELKKIEKDRENQIKTRARSKEAARDKLLSTQQIELMKKAELNRLKTADIGENLHFLHQRKQQMQDFWYKAEYLKTAFNTEVTSQVDTML